MSPSIGRPDTWITPAQVVEILKRHLDNEILAAAEIEEMITAAADFSVK